MDTSPPPYLNYITIIAKSHDTSSMEYLGEALKSSWSEFEAHARAWAYDILVIGFDISEMKKLCDLLYRVPDCSHEDDVSQIKIKDAEYGGSWHKRGGQGAFFMLSRKWDRLEKQIENAGSFVNAIRTDRREEGILDDLGDLRRYLILVLSWHHARSEPQQAEIAF